MPKKNWHIPCLPIRLWATFGLNCKLKLTFSIFKCQCECSYNCSFHSHESYIWVQQLSPLLMWSKGRALLREYWINFPQVRQTLISIFISIFYVRLSLFEKGNILSLHSHLNRTVWSFISLLLLSSNLFLKISIWKQKSI